MKKKTTKTKTKTPPMTKLEGEEGTRTCTDGEKETLEKKEGEEEKGDRGVGRGRRGSIVGEDARSTSGRRCIAVTI